MSAPVIFLPGQFEGATLSRVAADVISHAQNGWPPVLTFDFGNVCFVRPSPILFLTNLLYWLQEKGTKSTLINCNINSDPIKYLDDSLFFEQHCSKKISEFSAPRQTTQPLLRIAHRDSHAWLEANFLPWLAARLRITE